MKRWMVVCTAFMMLMAGTCGKNVEEDIETHFIQFKT